LAKIDVPIASNFSSALQIASVGGEG